MIKLGLIVRDKVTGLVGVAENRATFLYGCDRYFVQPQIDGDGKIDEGRRVDEPQLEIMEDDPVMEPLAEPKQTISLGSEVNDPIINRKGTATGRAVYLNGCSRILVEPKHKMLPANTDSWWVDELQLEVKKDVVHKQKAETRSKGGPARSCSKY